jgi:hypothetical protein
MKVVINATFRWWTSPVIRRFCATYEATMSNECPTLFSVIDAAFKSFGQHSSLRIRSKKLTCAFVSIFFASFRTTHILEEWTARCELKACEQFGWLQEINGRSSRSQIRVNKCQELLDKFRAFVGLALLMRWDQWGRSPLWSIFICAEKFF